jgi:hypothetical protein
MIILEMILVMAFNLFGLMDMTGSGLFGDRLFSIVFKRNDETGDDNFTSWSAPYADYVNKSARATADYVNKSARAAAVCILKVMGCPALGV